MTQILVVDDNQQNLYILQVLLKANGYEVEFAANGAQALEKAEAKLPDLIVSDILMPVMDGFMLCRKWKADQRFKDIPFIFYTATYTDPKDEDFALSLGAERFILKPLEPVMLLKILKETIETHNPGKLQVQNQPVEDADFYKSYNAALIRKLEDKVLQLEQANLKLEMDIARREKAEEQLRLESAALQAAANAIVITDTQGLVQWINPAFTTLTGYSMEEAAHKNLRILKSGFQSPTFYENLWSTILAGKIWRGELINKRKNGSLYSEEMTITPVTDEYGRITQFIAIKQDVSERKQAELVIKQHVADLETLYENGLKLARMVDMQQIADCVINMLEEQLHWHHAVLRFYNPERDILEVLSFSQIGLDPEKTALELERLNAFPLGPGRGMAGWVLQNRQLARCGNLQVDPRYVETFKGMQSGLYVPLMAADRVVGVISVESEQPDAFSPANERLLVTLAAQAAAAYDNARLYTETVHRLEELNTLVKVSAALRAASNVSEMLPIILKETSEALEASGVAYAIKDPATGEAIYELGSGDLAEYNNIRLPAGEGIIGWVIKHGQPYICQDVKTDPLYVQPVSVAKPPTAIVFAPLINQDQIIGFLVVGSQNVIKPDRVNLLQTITNIAANAIQRATLFEKLISYAAELEKRVEERTAELSASNAALEKASRLKDEFLASMSHELRTPLTGILGLSEVLQLEIYGELNPKQLKAVRNIESSGRHLLELINDILDLSKIEAGKLVLQIEECQVEDICQSSLQLVKGMARQKNQNISFLIEPSSILAQVDARRLKQMLVNLLSNAVKFTPDGGKLGLEVKTVEEDDAIYFSVWDKGIGIAPENLGKLFKPFVQLDSNLSRQYTGTGLGLSLVQLMAKLHGGEIKVESIPGEGSRFTISLPYAAKSVRSNLLENEYQSAEMNRPGVSPRPGSGVMEPGASAVVMIADDNEIVLETLTAFLISQGFKVVATRSGIELLERVSLALPDIILMDIQMPGIDGLETMRRLRAQSDPRIAAIPIIAVTALAMTGDREKCLQAGANDYISKPVALPTLVERIKYCLAHK